MSSIGYMKQLYERMFVSHQDYKNEVRGLLDVPMFLPADYFWDTTLPNILLALVFVSVTYVVSFYLVDPLLPAASQSSESSAGGGRTLRRRKLCYQMTNFLANLILGVAGFYFNAPLPETPTATESIQREPDTSFFAAFQLGYQIWAIFVGLLYVKEDKIMIAHHFGVINDAMLMVFFTNGMRYWGPFMFGCMEISSVPLAVMNAFKDNPAFIDRFPDIYLYVRTIFAVAFLYVRVWMLVPRSFLMCYDNVMLWTGASDHTLYQLFNLSTVLSTMFLTWLQLNWGWIVFKSLCKLYFRLMQPLWTSQKPKAKILKSD